MIEKPDIVLERFTVLSESKVCVLHYASNVGTPNVRYIFDSETLKLSRSIKLRRLNLNKSLKQSFSSSDPKEIVIDEFIGQSIPLLLCENNFFLIILSFLLFRLFDISKPWPAIYFDLKIKNATGVLMDDIIAGLYSFLVVYLCI